MYGLSGKIVGYRVGPRGETIPMYAAAGALGRIETYKKGIRKRPDVSCLISRAEKRRYEDECRKAKQIRGLGFSIDFSAKGEVSSRGGARGSAKGKAGGGARKSGGGKRSSGARRRGGLRSQIVSDVAQNVSITGTRSRWGPQHPCTLKDKPLCAPPRCLGKETSLILRGCFVRTPDQELASFCNSRRGKMILRTPLCYRFKLPGCMTKDLRQKVSYCNRHRWSGPDEGMNHWCWLHLKDSRYVRHVRNLKKCKAPTPMTVQTQVVVGTKKKEKKPRRPLCRFKPGERGARVRVFQRRINEILKAKGYQPIKVTGVMDRKTCGAAVMIRRKWRRGIGSWKSLSKYATSRGCRAFRMRGCAPYSEYPKHAPKKKGKKQPEPEPPVTDPMETEAIEEGDADEREQDVVADEPMREADEEEEQTIHEEIEEAEPIEAGVSWGLWGLLALVAAGGTYSYYRSRKKKKKGTR